MANLMYLDVSDISEYSPSDNLTIGHLNVRSFKPNLEDVKNLLNDTSVDILGLSETWLKPTEKRYCTIENYKLFHAHSSGRRGTGVGFYVKETVHVEVIDISCLYISCECFAIKVNQGRQLNIAVLYRSFSRCNERTFISNLEDITEFFLLKGHPFILTGDFNINTLGSKANLHVPSQYRQLYTSLGLKQLLVQPTRITRTSVTLIDHTLVYLPGHEDARATSFQCDVSDHCVIICDIPKLRKPNRAAPSLIKRRNFHGYDPQRYVETLGNLNFHHVVLETSVDEKAELLGSLLEQAADQHAPIETFQLQNRLGKPKELDVTLTLRFQTKCHYYQLYRATGDPAAYDLYSEWRKKVKKRTNQLRATQIQAEIAADANGHDYWNILQKNCGTKKTTKTPEVDADQANTYFSSVGPRTFEQAQRGSRPGTHFSDYLNRTPMNDNKLSYVNVSYDDIRNAVHKMNDTAPGINFVTKKLLMDALPVIEFALRHVINASFHHGIFPKTWKTAMIKPLFKAGDISLPGNYRPISLLKALGKLAETLMHNCLYKFMSDNNRIPDSQSGYGKNFSCETSNFHLLSKACYVLNERRVLLMLALDMSKAFATVSHSILLAKLEHHGVTGTALSWLKSYLSDRDQVVVVGQTTSGSEKMTFGVPQGGVLSPLLFILFTADMPNALEHCSISSYADDTDLFCEADSSNLQPALHFEEEDYDNVLAWCSCNGLKQNTSKTIFLILKSPHVAVPENISVVLNGCSIKAQDSAKILGVAFDKHLSFKEHALEKKGQIFGFLSTLSQKRQWFSRQLLKMLVDAYVNSVLQYCLTTVGTSCEVIKIYQQCQNFGIRVIFGLPKFGQG